MKSLCTIAITLIITIGSLHTEHKGPGYDSTPQRLAKATNDRASIHTAARPSKSVAGTNAQEPAGVLNQAGNVLLPAIRMFQ